MAVAVGEQRRKREAMDLLVAEISKGEEQNISTSIRVAIEVRRRTAPDYSLYNVTLFFVCQSCSADG
jgi:hypothetical protein